MFTLCSVNVGLPDLCMELFGLSKVEAASASLVGKRFNMPLVLSLPSEQEQQPKSSLLKPGTYSVVGSSKVSSIKLIRGPVSNSKGALHHRYTHGDYHPCLLTLEMSGYQTLM